MRSGLDARNLPRALTLGYTGVALLGTVAAVTVNVASYGPGEWGPTLMTTALFLFPAVFPIFFVAVGALLLVRVPVDRLIGDLPRPVIAAGIVVVAYVFLNFFFLVHLVPSTPYQQSNPSHQALMYTARLFTGHEILFFGLCAAVGRGLDRVRTEKLDLSRGPRDDSLERNPLPWPLSRNVTLQTMLSADEAAVRLQRPIPQGFFATMGRYGVRGEVTTAGFRLELGGAQTTMVYAVGRFEGGPRPTFIRVFLTFRRWALIAIGLAVLAFPAVWLLLNAFGQPLSWELLLFFLVFSIGGNLLFGIAQMNSLVNQIKRATDSQQVALG